MCAHGVLLEMKVGQFFGCLSLELGTVYVYRGFQRKTTGNHRRHDECPIGGIRS